MGGKVGVPEVETTRLVGAWESEGGDRRMGG